MSQYDTLNVYNNYNFIIEFYLQTIHTFVLARRNTIIFDSTIKNHHEACKAWARAFTIGFVVGIAMYSERGRTQSIINVTHLQLESKNVIWSINCKGKQSFRYELKQWNCKNIAITWCIVIAREQEKKNVAKYWLYTMTESICI